MDGHEKQEISGPKCVPAVLSEALIKGQRATQHRATNYAACTKLGQSLREKIWVL